MVRVSNRRSVCVAVTLVVVALLAAACSSSSKKASNTGAGGGGSSNVPSLAAKFNTYNPHISGKVQGGTVTWTAQPDYAPNYIFPMTNAQVCGTNNVEYLQSLLYRPLYWYGNNNNPSIDYDYSIGKPPVYSDNNQTVTVNLNNWKWSDGEQVTSRDVEFYVNVYKASPATESCYYVPPGPNGEKFFPDNVVSMSTPNPTTIVFHLSQSYNPTWFTYNELSQITPMPLAWDRTSLSAPAPTNDTGNLPDANPASAKQVYSFLDSQAKQVNTWASSPIWSIVDGPWKLSAFLPSGEVDFVPNPDFSGSPKPSVSKFVQLPFTDDNAIVTQMKTGGPSKLTVGQLPPQSASQLSSLEGAGYKSQTQPTWSVSYFPLNQNNPTLGPVFRQLYFRQAFQHLVDQKGWIPAFFNGQAYATDGPIPLQPSSPYVSSQEKGGGLGFNVNQAKQLLSSHGWDVVPNGTTSCQKPGSGPGECGPGVPGGLKLSFNLDYASGITSLTQSMNNLVAVAKQAGIELQLTNHDFNTVISTAVNCQPTDPKCKWTSENWGAGWIYAPDFYPTGESLFASGAAANYQNYSDPKADQLIAASTTASAGHTQPALTNYENYIVSQNPVVWQPTTYGNPAPNGSQMISSKLGGVTPNASSYITPEQWYFTS